MSEDKEPFRIVIECEGGKPQARIICGEQEFVVDGLALFAEGSQEGIFSFWWNKPEAAANAFCRTLQRAMVRGDEFAMQFYRIIFRTLALMTGANAQQISPQELLSKWDKEDTDKAVEESKDKKIFH